MAIVLSHDAVASLLPLSTALECTERALVAVSRESVFMPLRWGAVLPLAGKEGVHVLGHMPSYLPAKGGAGAGEWWHPATAKEGKKGEGGFMATKVVSVFPSNSGTAFSSHQGVVLLFDATNGSLLCIADAHTVTAVRTAAASGVATRLLAREDCSVLAIIGSGEQARKHLQAMRAVRPTITEVRVWSRTAEHAAAFAAEFAAEEGLSVAAVATAEAAVRGADIICTCTSSSMPLVEGAWIKEGAHLNLIGSCFPTQREADTATIVKSKLYVDTRAACLLEPGDLVTPLKEKAIEESHIIAEVGAVLDGADGAVGRENEREITCFKSVGNAAEDLCASVAIYEAAKASDQTFGTM